MEEKLTPTFVGIGAQKCATTWLSECLRYHPEVFMSSPKEIHFFGPARWDRGVDWYLDHFKRSGGYKAVGEFSTEYIEYPESAKRIKEVLGQVKILASLRNPTERFVSHYKQILRTGDLPTEYRVLNLDTFHEATRLWPRLLTKGKYHDNLEVFMDTFGRENVCVLLKEDIDKAPKEALRLVYSFLGVDPEYVPPILEKVTSPGIVPRFSQLERLRKRTFGLLNRKVPSVVVFIRKMRWAEVYRKFNADRRSDGFKIDDRVIEELNRYYQDEVSKIEQLLGRDLDAWRSN